MTTSALTPDSAIAAIERALDQGPVPGALFPDPDLMAAANPAALRLLLAALREAQEERDQGCQEAQRLRGALKKCKTCNLPTEVREVVKAALNAPQAGATE